MKIYLSGKISGLPYSEVQERFDGAEALLTELGFDVVNPWKMDLTRTNLGKGTFQADIAMLLPVWCHLYDGQLGWFNLGASIEYDVAMRTWERHLVWIQCGKKQPLSWWRFKTQSTKQWDWSSMIISTSPGNVMGSFARMISWGTIADKTKCALSR